MNNAVNVQGSRTSSGFTVGVLIDSVGSFFNHRAISNFIDAAEDNNIHLIFYFGGIIRPDTNENANSYVYTLPDPHIIQALIIFPHSISPTGPYSETKSIIDQIPGIPVYSFFYDFPDSYSIWINETPAINSMIQHLVKDHNYSKFALLCGPDSQDSISRQRQTGIEQTLLSYGIHLDPSLVFSGNFSDEDGKQVARRILSREGDSPEVLICLNDQMAIGAVKEFLTNGISVPEDIAVIGFDDVEENSSLACAFTTINFPVWDMTTAIIDRVYSDLSGKTTYSNDKFELLAQFMHRESCGCTSYFEKQNLKDSSFKPLEQRIASHATRKRITLLRQSLEDVIEKCIDQGETTFFTNFIQQAIRLLSRSGDLTNAFIDTFSTQWTITLLRYPEINTQVLINTLFVDAFRLLIQTKMKSFSQIHSNDLGSIAFYKSCNDLLSQKISLFSALKGIGSNLSLLGINRCALVFISPDDPNIGELRISYKEGFFLEIPDSNYIRFPIHELINTGISSIHDPVAILPVAHNTTVYGYIILSIRDKGFDQFDMIQELVSLLVDSSMANNLLSTHIQSLTSKNDALSRLSVIDEFTGLFNRRALFITGQNRYQQALQQKEASCFIFLDMDGLKIINDSYGHTEGDAAIFALAEILKKSFRENDLIVRYGGDEFVVLMINIQEKTLQKAFSRITTEINAFNNQKTHAWTLSASWGYVFNEADALPKTFENIIEESDAKLYEEKRKKRGRS